MSDDDDFVRACAGGRVIVNPAKPLWAKPCPKLADLEPLVIDMDDGSKLGMLLCPAHMADLTGMVYTWESSLEEMRDERN